MATSVQRDSCGWSVLDEPDVELEPASLTSALAMLGIAAAALGLALLPAIVALRLLEVPFGSIGAGIGFLGAAVGGVKLIAMAWAVGGRLRAGHPARPAVAAAD
ncbi:MAG TPA: hypothetical protein VKF16_02730 [Candidatus Dormibacteraeota bacterium]|nr:hypothetical protein [Candidatus Dormibacteraeota bacterium]